MTSKTFEDLCRAVEEIDADAAKYLRGKAQSLPCFYHHYDLCSVMVWRETKQGARFWGNIHNKLIERGYYAY